jgi:hypothetical protein
MNVKQIGVIEVSDHTDTHTHTPLVIDVCVRGGNLFPDMRDLLCPEQISSFAPNVVK